MKSSSISKEAISVEGRAIIARSRQFPRDIVLYLKLVVDSSTNAYKIIITRAKYFKCLLQAFLTFEVGFDQQRTSYMQECVHYVFVN